MKIFPSLLSANFSCLRESIEPLAEAGTTDFHLDVMDGNFVPNISYGPPVIRSISEKFPGLTLDAHLMVEEPTVVLEPLLEIGVDLISVHAEIRPDLEQLKRTCSARDVDLGLVFNPATSVEKYLDQLEFVDFVLLMSVRPGFGGQEFKPEVLEKIPVLRQNFDGPIQMDGGLGPSNISEVSVRGVDWFVAGSAVFGAPDPVKAVSELEDLAEV